MTIKSLTEQLESLSPEQRAVVSEFIRFLKQRPTPINRAFSEVVGEFMDEHPELLAGLAQGRKFRSAQKAAHDRYGKAFKKLAD